MRGMKFPAFTLFAFLALSCVCRISAAETPPARKPNFVFIFTDDQRYDAMSVVQKEQGEKGRFPWLKTPNMDRLAAEGVRFRNAFVVNALCAPSRASVLTGCYGHVNGVVNNHTPFPAANTTCTTLLRGAGYTTGYVGKWHMGSQSGQRPGFDFSASFVGQGKYFDCPIEVNGKPTPSTGWVDDVSTDYAEKFIREQAEKPFLLILGFKTCHGPFSPPPRHAATYENEQARSVPNLTARAVYRQDAPDAPRVPGPRAGTNLGMFRAITAVDENIGRLLKVLDDLKLAGDTMVVFSSDNGFYLGEHGLGDKRTAYEESLRVPMIARFPGRAGAGKVVDRMVLNVDVAPTFLDFAGVAPAGTVHGRSWRPLFAETPPQDWRKAFFYSYFFERGFGTPATTAVRTETAKLVKYPGHDDWTEVFDLQKDPYELKNLATDPASASLRAELEAEYEKQSAAIAFRVPTFADAPAKDPPPGGKKVGKKKEAEK